jgi:hypothetical protein
MRSEKIFSNGVWLTETLRYVLIKRMENFHTRKQGERGIKNALEPVKLRFQGVLFNILDILPFSRFSSLKLLEP